MRLIGLGLTAAMVMWTGTAFAGAAEDAFLGKLVGSWTGTGTVTGTKNTSLDCTLSFKASSGKVSFSGKCNAEGLGPQSFSGVLDYNDKAGRYEATSGGASSKVTVGVKSGSSVVFTSDVRGIAGSGTSVMKVSASKIVIDTNVTQKSSGDTYVAHVVMSK